MQLLVALTAGLVFWLVAWTFGVKAFDAFLVTLAILLGAVTARLFGPYLRDQLGLD